MVEGPENPMQRPTAAIVLRSTQRGGARPVEAWADEEAWVG